MLARVRKAAVAGVLAGGSAAVAVLTKADRIDSATVSQAIGAFAAAGVLAAWATWRIPNAKA